MKRDDRIYDLIQILRDGRLHTAAELARSVGVSTRTIWRDMEMMARTSEWLRLSSCRFMTKLRSIFTVFR